MKFYALQYTDEKNKDALVGIDRDSGGYPYPIKNMLMGVYLAQVNETNLVEMKRYNASFHNQFTLVYVEVTISPV